MVELGKDKIDVFCLCGRLQYPIKPCQLIFNPVSIVGVEPNDPAVALVGPVPVFFITWCPVVRHIDVLEIEGVILFVISRGRVERNASKKRSTVGAPRSSPSAQRRTPRHAAWSIWARRS